jgi:hypothetical protein
MLFTRLLDGGLFGEVVMIKISILMCWNGIKTLCMLYFPQIPSSVTNPILHKRRIYVDTRLHHMLDLTMNIPFFQRGEFPGVVQNGSEAIILADPWSNGTKAAPFDQRAFSFSPWLPSPSLFSSVVHWTSRCLQISFFIKKIVAFYLILDVAVGGTNGWFPDGSEKPWLDGSTSQSFF